eukprot:2900038-Karenia_brevis.AAC.1
MHHLDPSEANSPPKKKASRRERKLQNKEKLSMSSTTQCGLLPQPVTAYFDGYSHDTQYGHLPLQAMPGHSQHLAQLQCGHLPQTSPAFASGDTQCGQFSQPSP